MKSYVRILALGGIVCIFAAFLTSCGSSQKLGCPMKITKATDAAKSKHC